MKVAVAGIGYVGLSLAVLLSQKVDVTAVTTTPAKAEKINRGESTIADREIEASLSRGGLHLHATTDKLLAYRDADYVIVATPTSYDHERQTFDTSKVEDVIEHTRRVNEHAVIVIKSTVPIGYTEKAKSRYHTDKIIFSPEFLREGKALYDNLHPSRIIIGADKNVDEVYRAAIRFAELLKSCAAVDFVETRMMGTMEAEAVKLFANSYLAMRVSFFNELDTYAEEKGMNTREIVEGICLDPRIGAHYNNPSFGYGGYCLPKDSRQLLSNYKDVPENLIEAIVLSNETRKRYIASRIYDLALERAREAVPVIGIYRLTMKKDSDNMRQSSILDIVGFLKQRAVKILVYEEYPVPNGLLKDIEITNDFSSFAEAADLIVANRFSSQLNQVMEKVYTRDLFGRD